MLGKQTHCEALKLGLDMNVTVSNALLALYSDTGAIQYFLDMMQSGLELNRTCLQVLFEQAGIDANFENQTREGMQYMHVKTGMPLEEHARNIHLANGSYLVRHYKRWMESVLSFGYRMMSIFTAHSQLTSLLEHVRNMPVIDEYAAISAATNISES
ncbi:hypothetical protein D8674_018746 [Pyrus ussuriensis x Pyrus communis]|uniref:Pentatricopeptide repeat-containing protein n=1 Tax=Pyrus ussuriensis x Pyrus communis TaxID=2448454 RepID=A0A5N5GIY3_9ROSA|nr:hypothetical protein D8674_018741 [Pyrus ussuriensis x Pyrus communis]KAB2610714.1 hypothetical protein D8674_018746 [Pyrus ussuriensis x Pyrus communis]